MARDRDDKYDIQEDGEYHFSDDQANYEVEPDAVKLPNADARGAAGALNQFRKPVIGAFIFLFLIFLAYRILTSESSTPTTEFPAGGAPMVAPTVAQAPVPSQPIQSPVQSAPPPPIVEQPKPSVVEAATPPPVAPPTSPSPTTINVPTPADLGIAAQAQAQAQAPALSIVAENPAPPPPSGQSLQSPTGLTQEATTIDKLILLEEQNTKIVSQLQLEYAQKMASHDAQNDAMQGKLQDLSVRIASIESTLSRLGKLIQGLKDNKSGMQNRATSTSSMISTQVAARPMEPKMTYVVQAIIPGRAWLKSDAGDTITVAEGDILKNYGRIMKIDPYDGVVEIDTGGKVVALSYGANND